MFAATPGVMPQPALDMFCTMATAAPGCPSMDLYADLMARRLNTIEMITMTVEIPTINHVKMFPVARPRAMKAPKPTTRMASRIHPSLGSYSLAIR